MKKVSEIKAIEELKRKLKVAAYARVSTQTDAMLNSLSSQVSYYNKFIQSHDEWIFIGVYVDEAKTGTKEDRKGFQELLDKCRNKKIDLIITKSISRFSRNTITTLKSLKELKGLGVEIYFEKENIWALKQASEDENYSIMGYGIEKKLTFNVFRYNKIMEEDSLINLGKLFLFVLIYICCT